MPSDSTPRRELSPFIYLLSIALLSLSVPWLPLRNAATQIAGGIVLTIAYVGLIVGFGLGVAKRKLPIPLALGFLALCALIWLAAQFGFAPILQATARELSAAKRAPTAGELFVLGLRDETQKIALIGGAAMCGTLLSRIIRHANMLVPVVAAITLIDIWGVLFSGPVAQMLANKATQPIAEKAMAAGPKLGAASAAKTGFSLSIPAIGVGDFLFIALLLSVLVNLGLNFRTSARLMWIFITIALLSILFNFWVPWPAQLFPLIIERAYISALPGLVFIGLGALLPNWKSAKFTREEGFALLYAGILVLILTVALYFGFKSALPSTPVPPTR